MIRTNLISAIFAAEINRTTRVHKHLFWSTKRVFCYFSVQEKVKHSSLLIRFVWNQQKCKTKRLGLDGFSFIGNYIAFSVNDIADYVKKIQYNGMANSQWAMITNDRNRTVLLASFSEKCGPSGIYRSILNRYTNESLKFWWNWWMLLSWSNQPKSIQQRLWIEKVHKFIIEANVIKANTNKTKK